MKIGVPKEIKSEEYRVGLTPAGARALLSAGHQVFVEQGAGEGAGLSDLDYQEAGASLVSSQEAWAQDLVVKVKEPQSAEYDFLRPGLLLFTYLHLAAVPELARVLAQKQVSAVAYETIETADGRLPLLMPMSEIAGKLAVQVGAHFLERPHGGSGVLLGGAPGAGRGRVTVLGAGVAGTAAVKVAVGMGALVTVLNRSLPRLYYLDDHFGSRISTMISIPDAVAREVRQSDLLVCTILSPGARAPELVSREMVASMRPGSVIVDVSIDQGGCVATSRPTTHAEPTFVEHGVIHYCVANMPSAAARTATFALTSVTLPHLMALAAKGLAAAQDDPALAKGVNLHQGVVRHKVVAQALNMPYQPLAA